MATVRQKIVVQKLVENGGKLSQAMRDAGYSEATVNNPSNITESKGFKSLLAESGLTDVLVLTELVSDIKSKPASRISELTLACDILGLRRRKEIRHVKLANKQSNHNKQGAGKHIMVVDGDYGSLEVNGLGVVKLTTKKGLTKNLYPKERYFWDADFTMVSSNHRLQPTSFVVSEFVRLISGRSTSSKLDFLTGVENLRVLNSIRRSSETGKVITIKA